MKFLIYTVFNQDFLRVMLESMMRNGFFISFVSKNWKFSIKTKIKGNFHTKTLYCFGTKAYFDCHKTTRTNDISKILLLFGSPLAKDYWHGYNSKWTENDFILFWNVTTDLYVEKKYFTKSLPSSVNSNPIMEQNSSFMIQSIYFNLKIVFFSTFLCTLAAINVLISHKRWYRQNGHFYCFFTILHYLKISSLFLPLEDEFNFFSLYALFLLYQSRRDNSTTIYLLNCNYSWKSSEKTRKKGIVAISLSSNVYFLIKCSYFYNCSLFLPISGPFSYFSLRPLLPMSGHSGYRP
jgi:hypothetical protein